MCGTASSGAFGLLWDSKSLVELRIHEGVIPAHDLDLVVWGLHAFGLTLTILAFLPISTKLA